MHLQLLYGQYSFTRRRQFLPTVDLASVIIVKAHAEDQHVRLLLSSNAYGMCEQARIYGIVRIHKPEIVSPRLIDATVPRCGNAGIRLMDAAKLWVFFTKHVAKRTGAICGAVVNKQKLIIAESGCPDTVYCVFQRFHAVVAGDDHTEIHSAGTSQQKR